MDEDEQVEKIRAGRSVPLEERQARWDRIQEWSASNSLAEMVRLEADITGVTLSRERIRAIKDGARPGSVGRPKLPGLLAQQRYCRERVAIWRKKPKTPYQAADWLRLGTSSPWQPAAVKAEQKRLKALK